MTGLPGFEPTLQIDGSLDEVPDDLGDQLLLALREALSNAARHAGASAVEVRVRAAHELALIVRDNGTGHKDVTRRSALKNPEKRAAQLGCSRRVAPVHVSRTAVQ